MRSSTLLDDNTYGILPKSERMDYLHKLVYLANIEICEGIKCEYFPNNSQMKVVNTLLQNVIAALESEMEEIAQTEAT